VTSQLQLKNIIIIIIIIIKKETSKERKKNTTRKSGPTLAHLSSECHAIQLRN